MAAGGQGYPASGESFRPRNKIVVKKPVGSLLGELEFPLGTQPGVHRAYYVPRSFSVGCSPKLADRDARLSRRVLSALPEPQGPRRAERMARTLALRSRARGRPRPNTFSRRRGARLEALGSPLAAF